MKLTEIRDAALTIASAAITLAVGYALYDSRKHEERMKQLDAARAADRAAPNARITQLDTDHRLADIDTGCPTCGNNGYPDCHEPDRRSQFAQPVQ